ncbi:MAG: sulfotransferase, partial [Woeseia sp.]
RFAFCVGQFCVSDDPQAFYQQMSGLIRAGRSADAITQLRAWLQAQPADPVGTSMLGSALLRSEQPNEAIEVFRSACERNPTSFAALGDLGFACVRTDRDDEAMSAFQRAVELNPDFYHGWCYLSRLQFARDDLKASRSSFERAEACDPLLESFHEVQQLMRSEKYAEAEQRCRTLLNTQPGYPRAAYTLAQLAARVGAFEEGGEILKSAIAIYPADVNLRAAYVVSQEEAGRYSRALAAAQEVVAFEPDKLASWLILGRVHGHCGNYSDALAGYDKALGLCANDPELIGNVQLLRGHILKILGRYDESVAAYRSSIESSENNGAGWWGLADMKTVKFTDADIAALRSLLANESAKNAQRTQAAFALGKAFEDRASYAEAFDSYAKANAMRDGVSFSAEQQRQGVTEIIRAFDAPGLATQAEPRPSGPRPIFIVGLPRSGSTLIEQILASHTQVEGTMELATLPDIVRRITIDGGKRNIEYPSSMVCFSAEELAAYGQSYLDDTAMYRTDRPHFIDKLPTNFDKIGLIHKILPEAIVIDARRHPLDCGFSAFKQHFAGGHLWSYRLEHIAAYYNSYLALMDHWDRVLAGKVLCMHYEDVVADTEAAVRRLLQHCELPYEESCLRFFENRRPVRTASSEQVRQPIYRKGVAHWRHFERQLQPLIDALGEDTLARFER